MLKSTMNQSKLNSPANGRPQTLKGFRDFLPKEMAIRNYVKNTLTEVFENFGFLPLETPALEYSSVLKGKYSNETDDKLGYFFKDNGDREIGLRYDLTVPVSKVLAIYANTDKISLPFKRYQIQPVWRAENTQRGRYREFVQCDVDIFGTDSPISDAEIISIIYTGTQKLNFKNAIIKINSRAVLSDILDKSNIKTNQSSILQSLDKIDKIGEDGVKEEFISKGLTEAQINDLFKYIKQAQPDENLQKVLNLLSSFNIPKEAYIFDPTLVRGCDYYTGTIFEVTVNEANGSIGGGGRYDKLIETLGGPQISAVGFAFGFERVVDVIEKLNLLPELNKSKTKILIANFGSETQNESIKLVSQLRQLEISSAIYPDSDKLGKQIKYALDLGIKYLAIIGTDEVKNNVITLKDLDKQEQQSLSFEELVKILK